MIRAILFFFFCGYVLPFLSYGSTSTNSPNVPHTPEQITQVEFLDQYCSACHKDLDLGNFSLSNIDLENPSSSAQELERMLLKLKSGMMPPVGMPQPKEHEVHAFVSGLEKEIDRLAAISPNPGRPILHRLNRTEYVNSVRDLVGLNIDPKLYLPPDDMTLGFDNISDVLTISPTLLDSYINTAAKISRMAIGDNEAAPVVETFVVPQTFSQMHHVPGTPFGTRGGTVRLHNFPADGDYIFVLSFYYASIGAFFGDNIPAEGTRIEIAIDGNRVALIDIPRNIKATDVLKTQMIEVTAGPHQVSASFIANSSGLVEDFVMPFERALVDLSTGHFPGLTGLPHLRNLGINGPYNVTGVSQMPTHERIFTCYPMDDEDELPCAKQIIEKLARQAFRRPVTQLDTDRLMIHFKRGADKDNFKNGIRHALQAILADPEFIFRFERQPERVNPGENYAVTDLELASRLSYFLWSSSPDDQLIKLATNQMLSKPIVLEKQIRRMLNDKKAEALTKNFATHWLRLQNLEESHPDSYLFPNWDRNLTLSMRKETELLFESIVRENRDIIELLKADYTFVNGRLARHYQLPNVFGNRFRRVQLPTNKRRGLLGHGSILTLTSMAHRTSPVLRGTWLLEVILGTPPPTPPANVPSLQENETGRKLLSVRSRLLAHRQNPACGSCHNIIDPLGFSLENFDAVGAWRANDGRVEVDPSGTLFDGTLISGPADLRAYLVRKQDLFVVNFTKNLLMYALGRVLHYYDMPAVRKIVNQASDEKNRFLSFVTSIVQSTPFQMRRAEERESQPNDLVNQW